MDVLMPQLGETVAEGKLTKWLKKVGDVVAAGELLFEIETDKTSMEVPTMVGGVIIEIRVQEGETVPVSSIVARIEGDNAGESASRSQTAAASPAATPPLAIAVMRTAASAPIAQPLPAREIDPFNAVVSPAKNFGRATLSGGVKITPLARRLAAQSGIDASKLQGSGPRGRITAADVNRSVVAPAASSGGSPPMGLTADQVTALYKDVPHREIPLDGMRKTIARRLVESKQTVPHFYLTTDVSIEELLARIRAQLRSHEHSEGAVFRLGAYEFRPAAKLLLDPQQKKIRLTEKETNILKYLYRAGSKPVSREELLTEVWGYNAGVTTHTLETHIYRLRQKIERDPAAAAILITDRGGYRLQQ